MNKINNNLYRILGKKDQTQQINILTNYKNWFYQNILNLDKKQKKMKKIFSFRNKNHNLKFNQI
jgi:hypothetical protein